MMTPLIIMFLLTSPLGIAFLISKVKGSEVDVRKYALWGLGISFIFFSIGHAVKADGMVQMLPPWVPFRLSIIYLTGVLELCIGTSLFLPKLQIHAARIAIVLFIVFFPANIYAALNATGLGGHQWGAVYLLIRLPLQLILIAWAYFLCLKSHNKSPQRNAKASIRE